MNKSDIIEVNVANDDSIRDWELPQTSGGLLDNYIENQDSVFKIVEKEVLKYAKTSHIIIPTSAVSNYEIIEILLNQLYNIENTTDDYANLFTDYQLELNKILFLNHYLNKKIHPLLENSMQNLMEKDSKLTKRLIETQHDFLKSHIDDADLDGKYSFIKYFNIDILMNKDRNQFLKDLYFSLSDKNYHPSYQFRYLTDDKFEQEYNHIEKDLIPVKLIIDKPLPNYNAERDKKTLKNVQKAWNDFINFRMKATNSLPLKFKKVWNNATYRFQRSNLILLKNEYKNIGITSNDNLCLFLSDSCTYEELLAYSNFSTKRQEYCGSLQ